MDSYLVDMYKINIRNKQTYMYTFIIGFKNNGKLDIFHHSYQFNFKAMNASYGRSNSYVLMTYGMTRSCDRIDVSIYLGRFSILCKDRATGYSWKKKNIESKLVMSSLSKIHVTEKAKPKIKIGRTSPF